MDSLAQKLAQRYLVVQNPGDARSRSIGGFMAVAQINVPPAVQKAVMELVGPQPESRYQSAEEAQAEAAEAVVDTLHIVVEEAAKKLFTFALTKVKGSKVLGTSTYENGRDSTDRLGRQVSHHYTVDYPTQIGMVASVKGASTDRMAAALVKGMLRDKIRPEASGVKKFFSDKAVISYMEKLFKSHIDGLVSDLSQNWEYTLPAALQETVEEKAYDEVDVEATSTTYDEDLDEDTDEEPLSVAVNLRTSLQKLTLDTLSLSGGTFNLKLSFQFGVKVWDVYLPWDREYHNFSPF